MTLYLLLVQVTNILGQLYDVGLIPIRHVISKNLDKNYLFIIVIVFILCVVVVVGFGLLLLMFLLLLLLLQSPGADQPLHLWHIPGL